MNQKQLDLIRAHALNALSVAPDDVDAKDKLALLAEIDHLRGVIAKRWIPVAERLPESTMWYLIVICRKDRPDFRWVDFKIFDKAAGTFVVSGPEYFTITHWQPLPDGPEVANV
jgi:hypothetical protein